MQREPRAEGVFYKAMVDLTRSMQQNDPELGIRALDTCAAFVVDLATEHEGGDWNKRKCPELTKHKEKLGDV